MQPARLQTAPKTTEQVIDSSRWRLNLIRQTGTQRVALLNGRLVNVGGRIDGALVTEIDAHQVTLKLPDQRSINLTLPSAQLRRIKN